MIKNDKMKTLTIEHLSAYLPYGLKFISGHYLVGLYGGGSDITRPILLSETMSGQIDWEANMDMDKPLLRPLSQLTETIEHNGERFVPIIEMAKKFHVNQSHIVTHYAEQRCSREFAMVHCCVENSDTRYLYYQVFLDTLRNKYQEIKYLQSLNFDTFGLIEAGLAISIPSIEQP